MTILQDSWDEWLGDLLLKGVDPRGWDLNGLLAAFEAAMRSGSKDEAAWRRARSQLYAEPREVRQERVQLARNGPQAARTQPAAAAMTLDSVEALLASAAAAEARYGG